MIQSMGAPHATMPQGNQCVLVKWQKTGVRGKPEPDPLLGFLWEMQGRAEQTV